MGVTKVLILNRFFFMMLALLVISNQSNAAVYCVNTGAALRTALSTAENNAEDDDIKIVQGTYVGNFIYTSSQANKLSIRGGYDEGCANRTIDPANTIIDGNKYNYVLALYAPNVAAEFLIEGLALVNGHRSADGGGIYVATNQDGQVKIEKNIVAYNSATNGGGGIVVTGTANLVQNTIAYNSASSQGGGLSIGAANITLSNNWIRDNISGTQGGGAYLCCGTTNLAKNLITTNTSNNQGGGGIHVLSATSVIFNNNAIMNNQGKDYGGGTYIAAVTAQLRNNIITGNAVSGAGGGVSYLPLYLVVSELVEFTNNSISKNSASEEGGGIFVFSNVAKYTGNIISENISGNPASYSDGGGIHSSSNHATFTNNTIFKNIAHYRGGGVFLSVFSNQEFTYFYNNLMWLNSTSNLPKLGTDIYVSEAPDIDLYPNPIFENNNLDLSRPNGIYFSDQIDMAPSNLDKVDPLFVDLENGNLSLDYNSSMIDAGFLDTPDLPSTDVAGNPRVVSGVVDIGAFEYHEYEYCDMNQLTLDNETIMPGGDNYSSEVGIDTQGNVIISSGADVILTAPVIQLNPGFKVEPEAQLLLKAQAVTCSP